MLPISKMNLNPVFDKNDFSKPERFMRQIIHFLTSIYGDVDLGNKGRSVNANTVSRALAYLLESIVPNLVEHPRFNPKEV